MLPSFFPRPEFAVTDSIRLLRAVLSDADGQLWVVPTDARRQILRRLADVGPNDFSDILPARMTSTAQGPTDAVGWYMRWIEAHLMDGQRPAFDLSDDQLLPKGPRVLLVSPVYRLDEASIGLIRIAFFLRGLGIRADWIAATPNRLDDIVRMASNGGYDVIGHGTTHYTFDEDMRLLGRTAEASPESEIVLGGHGAVFEQAALRHLLLETPVSYVVRGFGERSTARLALAHSSSDFGTGLRPEQIPGIHLIHEGGLRSTGVDVYKETEFRALHAIFDASLYPVEDGVARLITSTHCPFACVFCSSRNFPEQPATRLDPQDVVNLVCELKAAHPDLTFIEFNDDNFSIGYRKDGCFRKGTQWLAELCAAARDGCFDGLRTYCYSRADTIDPGTLELLVQRTNLAKIGIGLEHVNHAVLRKMKKGTGVTRVLDRIRQAVALGVDTNFFVILFSKWETRETLVELIDVSSQLALEGAHVVYNWGFQPLRGADVSTDPSNEYLSSDHRIGQFHFEQRGKIVPDEANVGGWFRQMHSDLDRYFALQDELLARVRALGAVSRLDDHSPWLRRVFRPHQNVNLSDTLTNLVRFHSMFEYACRFIDSGDSYFSESAKRTWCYVLAYVFNGPTHEPGQSQSSIRSKIAYLTAGFDIDATESAVTALVAELDVVRVGLRIPEGTNLTPDAAAHEAWARRSLARWRRQAHHVPPPSSDGVFVAEALQEIEGWLRGRPPETGTDRATIPDPRKLDYIV